MQNIKKAIDKILKAKHIVISGHVNPDGDSIGSVLSLGLGLRKLGKKVYTIGCDGVPKRYRFLPGANKVLRMVKRKCDLAISVDCGNKEMLGRAFDAFEKAKEIIEIDHHGFRRPFGDISVIDEEASAVGELIFIILKKLKIKVTKDIAQNLLTSIIVETDSFRLPNVRPFAFSICADLLRQGVNFYELVDMIYWTKTREQVILSGICLSRCKFLKQKRIVWSIIKREDFKKVGGRDEDVDAVADEMRSIKDVKIAVLFREKGRGRLRVSLRSKDKINIASVAESFGGGGHFDVAGCQIPNSAKSIKELLVHSAYLLKSRSR